MNITHTIHYKYYTQYIQKLWYTFTIHEWNNSTTRHLQKYALFSDEWIEHCAEKISLYRILDYCCLFTMIKAGKIERIESTTCWNIFFNMRLYKFLSSTLSCLSESKFKGKWVLGTRKNVCRKYTTRLTISNVRIRKSCSI